MEGSENRLQTLTAHAIVVSWSLFL